MCDVNIMGKGDTMIHNSSASVRMMAIGREIDPKILKLEILKK